MDPKGLIQHYLLGDLNEVHVRELDRLLAQDAELRQKFRLAARVDTAIRHLSLATSVKDVHPSSSQINRPSSTGSGRLFAAFAAIAASGLIAIGIWSYQPATVAVLASSENAAWESSLPTNPGTSLCAGVLNLKTGIATIRFRSGAELVMEAPAQLELITHMKARLNSGAAVMEVPDSAKGFVLETPDGYAIDFGTRFAVKINDDRNTTDFQLLEGEIEVHHPASGDSMMLNKAGLGVTVSADEMKALGSEEESAFGDDVSVERPNSIRVRTLGRFGTATAKHDRRFGSLNRELLYVKKQTPNGRWGFRSFFEFNIPDVALDELTSASLRLNQVPSHKGSASLLPIINRFAVYGMTNPQKAGWKPKEVWNDAPAPEDGVLVGTFEIPRSQQRGAVEVSSDELLAFVKENGENPITFILVRETGRLQGGGATLTHMFASDRHPESVGPILELSSQ